MTIAEMVEKMAAAGVAPDMIALAVETCSEIESRATSRDIARLSNDIRRNRNGLTPDDVVEAKRQRDRLYQQRKRQAEKSCDAEKSHLLTSLLPTSECLSEKKEEVEVNVSARARRKSGATLPDDWQPSAKSRLYGRTELELADVEIDSLAQDLRRWAVANSNRAVARKANWDLTFDGWMKREAPKVKRQRGPPGGPNVLPFSSPTGNTGHDQRFTSDRRPGGLARVAAAAQQAIAAEHAASDGSQWATDPIRPRNGSRDP